MANHKCTICGGITQEYNGSRNDPFMRIRNHIQRGHPEHKGDWQYFFKETKKAATILPPAPPKRKYKKAKKTRKTPTAKKTQTQGVNATKVINVRVPLVINIPMVMGELQLDKAEIE